MNAVALALSLATLPIDVASLPSYPAAAMERDIIHARLQVVREQHQRVRAWLGYSSDTDWAPSVYTLGGTAAHNLMPRLDRLERSLAIAERDLADLFTFWRCAATATHPNTPPRERAECARHCRDYLGEPLFFSRAWWPKRR